MTILASWQNLPNLSDRTTKLGDLGEPNPGSWGKNSSTFLLVAAEGWTALHHCRVGSRRTSCSLGFPGSRLDVLKKTCLNLLVEVVSYIHPSGDPIFTAILWSFDCIRIEGVGQLNNHAWRGSRGEVVGKLWGNLYVLCPVNVVLTSAERLEINNPHLCSLSSCSSPFQPHAPPVFGAPEYITMWSSPKVPFSGVPAWLW